MEAPLNLLQLNAEAEGILTYIISKTSEPREGLAVLGMAICMLYDTCSDRSIPFSDFAEDLKQSLIATHADVTRGTGTMQ